MLIFEPLKLQWPGEMKAVHTRWWQCLPSPVPPQNYNTVPIISPSSLEVHCQEVLPEGILTDAFEARGCTELQIDRNKLFIVLFLCIFSMKCVLLKKNCFSGRTTFKFVLFHFWGEKKEVFFFFKEVGEI